MTHKLMCVSSQGGHWEQLKALTSDMNFDCVYVKAACKASDSDSKVDHYIKDWSRSTPMRSLQCAGQIVSLIRNVNPQVVITTGAAPGLMAVIIARIFGVKTVWVDSIANVERLSFSGKIASFVASLCVSQWEHLADGRRVKCIGSLL